MKRYEEPGNARFRRDYVDGVEQIAIPARRNWFVLLFLCFWLTAWTAGGIAAMYALTQHFELFLLAWLGGWLLGWLFAATTILWQLKGQEIIRVVGGDLEVSQRCFGFGRTKLYRGSDIRDLAASAGPGFFERFQLDHPIMRNGRWGSIKFSYGARTIYAAAALDEAEGKLVADFLAPRLPRTATLA